MRALPSNRLTTQISTGFLLAFTVLTLPLSPRAQTRIHRSLTVDDGLVQSQVNAVHEDAEGFLWLGTFSGISRWDGRTFLNYDKQRGLPGQDVRLFKEASGGRLLIGTHDGGLLVFDRGGKRFDTIDTEAGLSSNSIRSVYYSSDGRVHVATSAGVNVFSSDTFGSVTDTLLVGKSVSAIARRDDGGMYASTFRDGVFTIASDGTRPFEKQDALPTKVIRFVYTTRDGTVFISAHKNGLWTWRDGELAQFRGNPQLTGVDVKSMFEADNGALYLSTLGRGVAVWQNQAITWLGPDHGLSSDTNWGVTEGASGVVYIGTWGGVDFYYPHRTETIGTAQGLPHPVVTAIAEDADGTTYVGTPGGLAVWRDGAVERVYTTANGLSNNRIWSIMCRRNGAVYVGTAAGVNVIRDGQADVLYGEGDIMQGRVYDMHETADGDVYFATYEGVVVEREQSIRPLFVDEDLRRSTTLCIFDGGDGTLQFGTHAGVIVLKDDEVSYLGGAIADERVFSIAQARDGTMLYGTSGSGLFAGPDSVLMDIDTGLSDNTVYGIAVTDSAWYVNGHRGLNIIYPGAQRRVRSLRHVDGLASDECVQGGLMLDSRKRIWVGTIKGVTVYDPAYDPKNTRAPSVHISRVRLYDAELNAARFADDTPFNWDQNYFKFDFVGTNPYAAEKVTYRYRLSGIDRDWVASTEPLVQYTALPPGRYQFEVAAANGWGVWSEPAALAFRISPPLWKTWWFITAIVVAVVGTIGMIVYSRVRHLIAIERLRTRIASDLHDDIGAGLTEISVLSEVAQREGPSRSDHLTAIASTSRDLVASMSDIVWLVNPRRDSLHELATRLHDNFQDTMDAADIVFSVENIDALRDVRVGMEKRQHVYMLLKEAVHNAVKHSGATKINVTIQATTRELSLEVQDDGRGFDGAATHSGSGLTNMKERAAATNGRFEIHSTVGGGTRVTYSCRI